ncbi:MAG: WXG100 family type VII secretion target [Ruminococcus sp.]|nr:WXG100 family type VII secretion target [Ruminococcus sp.]
MAEVKMNTSAFKNDINGLRNEFELIEAEFRKIYKDVEYLGTMWKGRASTAFGTSFSKDYENVQEVLRLIKNYINRLETEHKEYEKCENKVIDIVQSV